MKKIRIIIGISALALGLSGCSSAYYRADSGTYDDLYAVHDRAAIAKRQQAEAEARRAAAEARQAEWEARLAEAQAAAAEEAYYDGLSYDGIVADDYESAYARRLRGFQSMTYNLPSSYFELRYNSPTWNYVSAYDPAFYNVIVMGDEVWVEPKYITSMFGSWGSVSVYNYGWYFGFGFGPAYSWWGYPHYSWWDWNMAYYNPWYYPWWYGPGWGWAPGYPPYYPGWGGPHWSHHHRPNYRLAGGGTSSRYRPGNVSGSRYQAEQSGGYRSGTTTPSRGNAGAGRTYYQSGGRNNANDRNVYNSGSSGSNRNTYTPNRNTYTPERNTYTPSRTTYNSTPSRGGSGFSTGSAGSRGGSVGGSGGGSRGGSTSGGSRGFGGR